MDTVIWVMVPSDSELLLRWRSNDKESGEALFDRYYEVLERFFLNKVDSAAQDLVQDTFKACVEGRDQISVDGEFKLYMLGVAYNVLKGYLRNRYRAGQEQDIEDTSIQDLMPGPVTLVARQREHRLLLAALREIPIMAQVVLELHYWEHLTTEEISQALRIPVGTARGQLQRARDKVKEVMTGLAESPEELASTVARLEDWARECQAHLSCHHKTPK